MRNQLKVLIRKLVASGPQWLEDWLKRGWQQRHCRRYMEGQGIPALIATWVERHGLTVLSGPFFGLKFVNESAGSMLMPKLLGSYESELHPIFAELFQSSSEVLKVIDVGCAEGYYAVGLACRLPNVVVHAYDIDQNARRLCREMAQMNAVGTRVEIHGRCNSSILNKIGLKGALVICDCEGFEYQLLNPQLIPSLCGARILVELHGTFSDTEALIERFRSTHLVRTIPVNERNPEMFPALAFLSEREQYLATSEFRNPDQEWAYLEPRVSRANN